MKTKEELNELKEEVEAVNKKLAELTEEELKSVSGGRRKGSVYCWECGYDFGPRIYLTKDSPMEYCPNCKKEVYVHG